MKAENDIRENSFMIISNIAMLFIKKPNIVVLRAVDLNDLTYVAEFKYDKSIN